MRDGIHMRVSLAVLPIDDYLDRPVTSAALRVSVKNGGGPVLKDGGFRVFMNLTGNEAVITAEGAGYVREERTVDISALDRTNPVVPIRMRPDRGYPLPENAVRILARLPAGAELFMFGRDAGAMKLLEDYKGGGEIRLYRDGTALMDGKTLCITDKSGRVEVIRIGNMIDRDSGTYSLECRPESVYKKAGTRVYPVMPAGGSGENEYFMPLSGDGIYTCVLRRDKKLTCTQATVAGGHEYLLDFRDIK